MLDYPLINKKFKPIVVTIRKERLQSFAKATSQTDPIYYNENVAIEKGHPSILAPLTFLTTIGYEQDKPYQYIADLGIDLQRMLHAGQTYKYYYPIYAGDSITMEKKIVDIYDKKNGALQFIKFQSTYTNQNDIIVSVATFTIVIKQDNGQTGIK